MRKINIEDQAQILAEALPYIQKYQGKIIVIKYGGSAMTANTLKEKVMQDVALLSLIGIQVVLVHGGGPEITETLEKMQIKTQFKDGLRVTDAKTLSVVQMVLAGKINKDLVLRLGRLGAKAIGLCGLDANILKAKPIEDATDLGYVGCVSKVKPEEIQVFLKNGYTPIISTLAADEDGQVYNLNADYAASSIASALQAENLIFMTDTKGLLKDPTDESSLMTQVLVRDVPELLKTGIIQGGMIPKVNSCVQAVRNGVKKAVILNGQIAHATLIEVLTQEGIGTLFQAK